MNVKDAVVMRIQSLCAKKDIAINALANRFGMTPSTLYSVMDKSRSDFFMSERW